MTYTNPKIAAVCCTYNRPALLGRTIECFLRQTYTNCELVIYDDGGQYPDQPHGDRWRVISVKERAPNLGTKRNLAARHVSPDVDFIQTWDDDDIHLPHGFAAMVEALKLKPWARPFEALEWDGKQFRRYETYHRAYPTQIAYHGNWGYRLKEFWDVGGYPPIMDDDHIAKRMTDAYGLSANTISGKFPTPAYAYSRVPSDNHLSWDYSRHGMEGAWGKANAGALPPATIPIGWDIEYDQLPIPTKAAKRNW
jgi:glycosyltransferase involved in cell wall biosynthesis